MVRCNLARYMKTALLGPADLLERSFCGKVCDVQPRAGEFGELNVARNTNGFRGRGHSGKTKTRGRDAFAHDGAGSERNIFRMLDDGQIERAAVVHHLAREFCRGDGFAVVANGDDAGLLHGGDFRDGFAFAADAGGADGPNAHAGSGFGAIENKARDAGVVVDRFRVRHAADGGEAAASVPVSMLSEDSCPGSRRCACKSIKPGATMRPVASKISVEEFRAIFPG